MLEIKNLHAGIEGKEILKGLTLTVNPGEVHAIMGPNGSGKSTLANVLAGRPKYEVLSGDVLFEGKNLIDSPTEERAREGIAADTTNHRLEHAAPARFVELLRRALVAQRHQRILRSRHSRFRLAGKPQHRARQDEEHDHDH
jgi:Fe-S cluster assembly ATPase SufC